MNNKIIEEIYLELFINNKIIIKHFITDRLFNIYFQSNVNNHLKLLLLIINNIWRNKEEDILNKLLGILYKRNRQIVLKNKSDEIIFNGVSINNILHLHTINGFDIFFKYIKYIFNIKILDISSISF